MGINEWPFNTRVPDLDSPTSTSASIDSQDGLWLSYGTAEYDNITTGFTDLIPPEAIPSPPFTPVNPLLWRGGYAPVPTPGQTHPLPKPPGIYTTTSYIYNEIPNHPRQPQHILHTGSFQPRPPLWKQPLKPNFKLGSHLPRIKPLEYKCKKPGCHGRFKRQEHVTRHMKSHLNEKAYVCWVPSCGRAFSRGDNLSAHSKTHSKRSGRNRYVSTLDETSPDYDPGYRGDLTPDGRPVRAFMLGGAIPGDVRLD